MRDSTSVVSLQARPAALDIDPATTAVVVVDMQHGFCGDGGWWDRAGVDVSGVQATVPRIAAVLDAARAAGMTAAYLTMDLEGADQWRSPRLARYFREVARPDTGQRSLPDGVRESDILTAIAPAAGDIVIDKPRHSGFFRTDLDDRLRERGVSTLIVTGCTTSVCVEATMRDAFFRDYRVVLLEDCVAEPLGDNHHAATVRVVELLLGWVSSADAFTSAMNGITQPAAATVG